MNLNSLKKLIQTFLGLLFLLTAPKAFAQATSDQYLAAGNQFYQSKDYAKAIPYYKAAIQTNPNSAAAYQGLGNCQYATGQKQEALASYDKALSLNPNNPGLVSFDQNLRAQVGNQPPLPPTSSGLAEDVLNPNASATVVQPTPAPNDPNSPRENNYWTAGHSHDRNVEDFYFGLAFYNGQTGFGGGSTYYFPLNKTFSIGVGSNVYVFSSNASGPYGLFGSTSYFAEVLLTCRYMLEGKTIRPYFIGGGGLDVVLSTYTGSYYSSNFTYGFDPMLVGGAGISIPLSEYICFFVQGKVSFVFAGSNTSTSINQTGYNTGTVNTGTLTYEPLELGFTLPI